MYTPASFAIHDVGALHDFIDAHGFGIIVGAGCDGAAQISHLPFLLDRERCCLFSHMARPNPQWQTFDGEREVVVVFHGDHGYISPGWYESRLAVPTWNYEAVHVRGRPRALDPGQSLVPHLEQLIARHEAAGPEPWSLPADPEYVEFLGKMERGIVGFEIPIEKLEGKAKMSQNRPASDRARVIDKLRGQASPSAQGLAKRMTQIESQNTTPGDG